MPTVFLMVFPGNYGSILLSFWDIIPGQTSDDAPTTTTIAYLTLKGPFIATQLNSTSSWVELCQRNVYSDANATRLNSTQVLRPDDATQLNWTQLNSTSSWVELRRRSVYSDADSTQLNSTQVLRPDDATQLNWIQLDVELSWVASL